MRQLYYKIILTLALIALVMPSITWAGHIGGQGFIPVVDEELTFTRQSAKRAVADNVDQVLLRVFARDNYGRPVKNVNVWITPERFATDTVMPPVAFTNEKGIASFNIRSRLPGVTVYRVEADQVVIHQTPIITWCAAGDQECLGVSKKIAAAGDRIAPPPAFVRNLPNNEALLKCNCHPNIYLLRQDKLYVVPGPEVFAKRGYKWEMVQIVSKNVLDRFSDRVLIRGRGDYRVYELIRQPNGSYYKRWIRSPQDLQQRGFNFDEIMVVNSEEIKLYPTQDSVKLLKTPNDDRVYLIENNVRRHIISPKVFARKGFVWDDVKVVSLVELLQYPLGPPLEN